MALCTVGLSSRRQVLIDLVVQVLMECEWLRLNINRRVISASTGCFLQLRMLIGQCYGPVPFEAIWPDMGTAVDMEQALSIALPTDIMSITLFRRLPVLGYTDQ